RKVLGASVWELLGMMVLHYLWLVLLAIPIAWLCIWWVMNQWLRNFALRQPTEWWVFVVSALLVVLLAFSTVLFHAWKAANADPVLSLRDE
ncbi:MAG: FtsX-like permease family protein, partial [Bacteroidota bacterium]